MKWFRNLFKSERRKQKLQGSYDVLQRRYETDHWDGAARQSANAHQTRERRQQLRDLARYEYENNPHLSGLLLRIRNEVIGKGPRLSVEPKTPTDVSKRAANRLETVWKEWTAEIDLNQKLREMCLERPVGGESFTVWYPNRNLETVPIGMTVYEGDQFQSPNEWDYFGQGHNDGSVDGIHHDEYGNIAGYDRLRLHPYRNAGNSGYSNSGTLHLTPEDIQFIDAAVCFHWYRKDRPSQHRGVSEVAPMLEVYSKLRRFIESKVGQEELRAKLMGSVRTGFSPDAGCADIGSEPIDMLIGDGQFTTLPDGWQVDMFKFDSTGQGVQEFIDTMLSWATQALLAPWNIASGNSSDYNFASGRLDHLSFFHYVDIIRKELEEQFLCRLFDDWSFIATASNRFPSGLGNFKCVWHWDKREAIDPLKQANADKTLKEAGMLDEVDFARREGDNALDRAERQIRFELEKAKLRQRLEKELGVKTPTPTAQEVVNDEDKQEA